MKKYKVVWEERHSAMVEAESEEKAIEQWENGEYEDKYEENTMQPEAYEDF